MFAELSSGKRRLSPGPPHVEIYTAWKRARTSLCDQCSKLQLDKVLEDMEPTECLDIKIANVGQYYRGSPSPDCHLCPMLSASRMTIEQLDQKPSSRLDSDELHAFGFLNHFDVVDFPGSTERNLLFSGNDSLYLAVVPSGFSWIGNRMALIQRGYHQGFLVVQRQDSPWGSVFVPQKIRTGFKPSLGKSWLDYCRLHHQQLCSPLAQSTSGLRLIDCHSFVVKYAPVETPYVALSYVWGLSTAADNASGPSDRNVLGEASLPSMLPATIVDAVNATMYMGFRYLWIDKYCIDQNDAATKHDPIRQMDSIYHNAELTIIVAAGQDPNYGLLGVGIQPRQPQQTVPIGQIEILSTMRHPHDAIKNSKWSRRAWTFQEAVLSRRRLVFTDGQVYFECNAMNCCEAVSSNLDELHTRDKSRFRQVIRAGTFGRNEINKFGLVNEAALTPNRAFVRFLCMIEKYSAGELTYDTDSLNAFSGIIRRFRTAPMRVGEFWGIPFREEVHSVALELDFVDGLAWNHKRVNGESPTPPRRRQGFPSWVMGWMGRRSGIHRSLHRGWRS